MSRWTRRTCRRRSIVRSSFALFLVAALIFGAAAEVRAKKRTRDRKKSETAFSRVEFPRLGISLELPTGWSRELTGGASRLLAREHPAGPIVAVLSVHTDPATASLDGAASHHRSATLPGSFPGCQILSEKPVCVGPYAAHAFHVAELGGGQPASELFETLVKTPRGFVFVSLYFAPGKSSDYEETYSRIRDSLLHIEEESAPETEDSGGTDVTDLTGSGGGRIRWHRNFDEAFDEALHRNVPVLIAFNMDNEPACQQILRSHYEDGEIVELSRRMVCLIGSTFDHGSAEEPCPRFGSLRCAEHRDVEIKARETYIRRSVAVAPQHLVISPDGRLLSRREYMLPTQDLAAMMRGAIQATERRSRYFKEGKDPDFFTFYRSATTPEARHQVIGDVLYSGDDKLARELFDRIATHRKVEGLVEVMQAFSTCRHPSGVEHAIRYLDNPSEFVRAGAARALQELAVPTAVDGLKKRLRRERIDKVKHRILRALGTCGAGDSMVADLLLKQAGRGPSLLRINALLALRDFEKNPRLEKGLLRVYGKERNHEVKAAAALLLGFHRVEAAVKPMEKDLEGVGKTRLADVTRWALSCIAGDIDPLIEFDNFAQGMSRDDSM